MILSDGSPTELVQLKRMSTAEYLDKLDIFVKRNQ